MSRNMRPTRWSRFIPAVIIGDVAYYKTNKMVTLHPRSADGNNKKAKKESKKLKIAKAYVAKVEKEKDSDHDSE
jgi:hypothetical protein